MEKLKPCPFCGSIAKLVEARVCCTECGAIMTHTISKNSSAAWNTRATKLEAAQQVKLSDKEICTAALTSGFMLSTGYGQNPNERMPVSDHRTLRAFVESILSLRPSERESGALSERDKLEVVHLVEKAVLSGKSWNGGGVLEAILERFELRRRGRDD